MLELSLLGGALMARDSILMFGRDAQLLETRQWVFERAGLMVRSVSTLTAVRGALAGRRYGLLILCHTLSEAECIAAGDVAVWNAPAMPILLLETGGCGFISALGASTNVLNGPKSLIAKVHSLFHPSRNLTISCSEEIAPWQSTQEM